MFYESLLALCSDRDIKVTNLVSVLNISSGNLSKWKAGGVPKGDTLSKIADYFNVTTDYLLGRTDQKTWPTDGAAPAPAPLSPDEQALLSMYQRLPDEKMRGLVAGYLARLLEESTPAPSAQDQQAI